MCKKKILAGLTFKNWWFTFTHAVFLVIFQVSGPACMHNYSFFRKNIVPGFSRPATPHVKKKKMATACENEFFILFSYFCFFFTWRVDHDVKPPKPLTPEATKIGCFFKSKKKSDESRAPLWTSRLLKDVDTCTHGTQGCCPRNMYAVDCVPWVVSVLLM